MTISTCPYLYLPPHPLAMRAPILSPDGYIRLPLASLDRLPLVHLFSESDTDFLEELQAQTVPAKTAGFSEWRSATEPAVSLGWGWFVHNDSDRIMVAPDGVRSNVMLIDRHGYDLGQMRTSNLFSTWLNAFEWQAVVSMALHGPASC
jgi:hypothetical protein